MDIRRVFGANMRRFRLAADLSQEAVAERMGVDRAHVSGMERGLQNVTIITLWQAAQALHCLPAQLLEDAHGSSVPSARVRAPRKRRTKQ
jgi:transcriptional regulator with XRE-family HTH domain